jgi:hypothetical protein
MGRTLVRSRRCGQTLRRISHASGRAGQGIIWLCARCGGASRHLLNAQLRTLPYFHAVWYAALRCGS